MKRKYLFGILILSLCGILFSCRHKKNRLKEEAIVAVSLKKEIDSANSGKSQFDYRYTDFFVFPLKEKYPDFYEKLYAKYNGIPKSDSLSISSVIFQKEKLYYDLYKGNLFSSESDKKRVMEGIDDSTGLSKDNYEYMLNVLSFYENGKHKLIIDSDNNNDFGDNKVFVYDEDFHFKNNFSPTKSIVDTIVPISIRYQVSANNKVIEFNRNAQVFPYPNYFLSQLHREKSLKKHGLLLRFKDYWKGITSVGGENYSFAVQGSNTKALDFVIKHDTLMGYKSNTAYAQNFRYRIKDTVLLSDNLYVLDSISLDFSKLFLNKLDIEKKFFLGHRMGYVLPNYNFEDIHGKQFSINDVSTKKYVLLDFWGTWCKPCEELVPDLKRMERVHSNQLNIIGIAYRDTPRTLKKYAESKKMDWPQISFIKKESILKDLDILNYPTYVLLDKDRKILYVGSGGSALSQIEYLINDR